MTQHPPKQFIRLFHRGERNWKTLPSNSFIRPNVSSLQYSGHKDPADQKLTKRLPEQCYQLCNTCRIKIGQHSLVFHLTALQKHLAIKLIQNTWSWWIYYDAIFTHTMYSFYQTGRWKLLLSAIQIPPYTWSDSNKIGEFNMKQYLLEECLRFPHIGRRELKRTSCLSV